METRPRPVLALKVDVDTERGTRVGVPQLVADLGEFDLPATFFFSLGPDNTGKAVRRVFRPGFVRKVSRTHVLRAYGVRTLLNGTLLPAPHIGRRHAGVMCAVREKGFEVGIHCHDHFRWQDHVRSMPENEVREEFGRARAEFRRIFGGEANAAAAPGWQTCAAARGAYDEAGLGYSSDCRGFSPFFARIGERTFRTLEIPTTLPTLDELVGRPEFPESAIVSHYLSLLRMNALNVLTLHAELEGMDWRPLFRALLAALTQARVEFVCLGDVALMLQATAARVPVHRVEMASIDGRSGVVAVQGREFA